MRSSFRPSWSILATLLFAGGLQPLAGADLPRWNSGYAKRPSEWYATSEARALADTLIRYQSPEGAWPKNTDLFKPLPEEQLAAVRTGRSTNTIDNNATTAPLRFLAQMFAAVHHAPDRAAVERGVDYLLAAQYPNGGWPQFYPLRPSGYYSHITYNDGAMVHALDLLREVAEAKAPFEFIDPERRAKAADAVRRGVGCILKTQVRQSEKLTVWCAQHDEKTLEPAWARTFEPPSLSGSESVGIVRFLMSIESPSPDVVAAIEGAVAWFRDNALTGVRVEEVPQPGKKPDRRLVADASAALLWARFYELGTNRPLYVDRDAQFRYRFDEIDYERRSGYQYHGDWPAALLDKDYPRWRKRLESRP